MTTTNAPPTAQPNSPGFTPGPWITEKAGSSGTLAIRVKVDAHNWMNVAEAFEPLTETVEEQVANARLIAAAPSLYAALAEIEECGTDDWDARMRTVRASLAIARGQDGGGK